MSLRSKTESSSVLVDTTRSVAYPAVISSNLSLQNVKTFLTIFMKDGRFKLNRWRSSTWLSEEGLDSRGDTVVDSHNFLIFLGFAESSFKS